MHDPVLNLSARINELEADEDAAHTAGDRSEAERLHQCGVAEWGRLQFTEPTTSKGVLRLLDYLFAGGLVPSFDLEWERLSDGRSVDGSDTTRTFSVWPPLDQSLRWLVRRDAPLPCEVIVSLGPIAAGAKRDGYPELANCLDRIAAWAAGPPLAVLRAA